MPNSYTEDIYEGKPFDLDKFVSRTARGMMMFIHQRDDSLNSPLRYPSESFNSIEYHRRELEKAERELAEWEAASEEDKYAHWSKYYEDTLADKARTKARHRDMRARYEQAIAAVEELQVEPLMESFKEYMLNMLKESMEFDAHGDDFIDKYYTPAEYVEWCVGEDKNLRRDVDYHTTGIAEGLERRADRIRYIESFERSFGIEVKR